MVKILNLDDKLGLDNDAEFRTKPVKVLGLEVRVILDFNQFAFADMQASARQQDGDPTALLEFIRSMIHPEDWPGFNRAAKNSMAMRGDKAGERFGAILNALMEVVTEVPTKQPSDLRRTAGTRSSVRKSPANSASAPAKTSRTSR